MDTDQPGQRGRTLAPSLVVALLNVVHLMIGAFCAFGGLIVAHSLLPVTIFSSLCVLSRFHDYCWLTKITQAVESSADDCKGPDVHPHAPFFDRFLGGSIHEAAGDRVIRNVTTLVISANVCVAVYRLSRHYKFELLPQSGSGRLVTWVLGGLVVTVYEEKPFCDACEAQEGGFTPLNKIHMD